VKVSAIIVTRGNVDLGQIVGSLPREWERICWSNGERRCYVLASGADPATDISWVVWHGVEDFSVFGRYSAIQYASSDVIYVQDDDCVTPAREIAEAYEPCRLVANMPRSRWDGYPDSTLVGWGAIFDRDLPGLAFERQAIFDVVESDPDWFYATCDVAFSALTPRTIVDLPFEHLPWAEGPDRMFTGRPTHNEERQRMLELCRSLRIQDDDDRRPW
jgi:hypothetical protein